MAISMSMGEGPGPGKQKKLVKKKYKAMSKQIAADKQARIQASNADPRSRKAGKFTVEMAQHNPRLPKNEHGMYLGTGISSGKARRNVRLMPKFK